ncbi:hypothetical protein SAMD00023353_4900640 [Rosellinia necatrix]|uniref:Uncharacterized protein n=1 Tax=Rosellinia necatrix TaxID=77044 RepID=A0A1W2TPN3_ROSNE|nr:hypothetical protein SAMD00023353_4900640 [Rosellinia necatrix]
MDSDGNDAAAVAKTGHIAVVASMIVFVVLTLILWALMGIQIHCLRKQRLSDLEATATAPVVDSDVPLENILRTAKSPKPNAKTGRSSFASWPDTPRSTNISSRSDMPHDSSWYAEERPVRYLLHKVAGWFKRKSPARYNGASNTESTIMLVPEGGRPKTPQPRGASVDELRDNRRRCAESCAYMKR